MQHVAVLLPHQYTLWRKDTMVLPFCSSVPVLYTKEQFSWSYECCHLQFQYLNGGIMYSCCCEYIYLLLDGILIAKVGSLGIKNSTLQAVLSYTILWTRRIIICWHLVSYLTPIIYNQSLTGNWSNNHFWCVATGQSNKLYHYFNMQKFENSNFYPKLLIHFIMSYYWSMLRCFFACLCTNLGNLCIFSLYIGTCWKFVFL
jgi:hypothetical protein